MKKETRTALEDQKHAEQAARDLEHKRGISERRKLKLKERKLKKDERKLMREADRIEDERFKGLREDIEFGDVVDRPPSFDDIALPSRKRGGAAGGAMSNIEILNRALAEAAKKAADAERALNGGDDDEEDEDGARAGSSSSNSKGGLGKYASVRRHVESAQAERAEEEARARREAAKNAMTAEKRQQMLAQARAELRRAEIDKAREQAQQAYRDIKARSGRGGGGFAALTSGNSQLRMGQAVAQSRLESVDGPAARFR